MSKFCSNCGAELNERDNFCPHCGKEIIVEKNSFKNSYVRQSFWKIIFTTKGRLNRLPYFKYSFGIALFMGILSIIIFVPIGLMSPRAHGKYDILVVILFLLFALSCIIALIAQIMLAIRRLHDLNFSGWWYLAYFYSC